MQGGRVGARRLGALLPSCANLLGGRQQNGLVCFPAPPLHMCFSLPAAQHSGRIAHSGSPALCTHCRALPHAVGTLWLMAAPPMMPALAAPVPGQRTCKRSRTLCSLASQSQGELELPRAGWLAGALASVPPTGRAGSCWLLQELHEMHRCRPAAQSSLRPPAPTSSACLRHPCLCRLVVMGAAAAIAAGAAVWYYRRRPSSAGAAGGAGGNSVELGKQGMSGGSNTKWVAVRGWGRSGGAFLARLLLPAAAPVPVRLHLS